MAVRSSYVVSRFAQAVLVVACAVFVLPAVPADLRMEAVSTKLVGYANSESFEGCAPAKTSDDPIALRMAVLQARASLSRSRNLAVGGAEKLVINNGDQHLVDQVREISESYQARVSIVEIYYVRDGGVLRVCVVIVENPAS